MPSRRVDLNTGFEHGVNRTDLLELIRNGENSAVEFKRDDIRPEKLAAEIAALLNLEGGYILLGVEDDGTVTSLTRESKEAEEWVMQVARDHVQPALIPSWQVLDVGAGISVGVIYLAMNAPDKPYKAKRGGVWITKVRVGTITRDASREEEQRLYQQSGGLRYGLKPVLGSNVDDLDHRRLKDYFTRVLDYGDVPSKDSEGWNTLLRNLDIAVGSGGQTVATVDGMLIFGSSVGRFLPQSGIRAICYPSEEPAYAARADEAIKGPMVSLFAEDGSIVETGVVQRAWDFVQRNTAPVSHLEGARRVDRWEFPKAAVREVLVNALVHRDYSIVGTDVTLLIFSNRIEVHSPGRLPNTVTVDGMKSGMRYARNQTLVNVMRDYRYVDARGMGIRNKVIPAMLIHNGTEPDLIEEEHRFIVRLWKTSQH